MNRYSEMRKRHQKMVDEFPMQFAFNDEQFKDGMESLGLTEYDTDRVVSTGLGGFIHKKDKERYDAMFVAIEEELQQCIDDDTTGQGFIKDMFVYELGNHEFGYTGEVTQTLRALGISFEEVKKNENLSAGLKSAIDTFN